MVLSMIGIQNKIKNLRKEMESIQQSAQDLVNDIHKMYPRLRAKKVDELDSFLLAIKELETSVQGMSLFLHLLKGGDSSDICDEIRGRKTKATLEL